MSRDSGVAASAGATDLAGLMGPLAAILLLVIMRRIERVPPLLATT